MSRIFISYRRRDIASARYLHTILVPRWGEDDVFFDPLIPEAAEFRQYLQARATKCHVLLVLIGANWLEDAEKRQPPDVEDDYVRLELQWAKQGGATILPVLLEETQMPNAKALSALGFSDVASAQASRIAFGRDNLSAVQILCRTIERLLTRERPSPDASFPARPPGALALPSFQDTLVRIPSGTFTMGSDPAEEGRRPDEGPCRNLTVDTFRLGETLVTNEQYKQFLEAHPRYPQPRYWRDPRFNDPDQPVVGVSWEDASSFCSWAGMQLPTEIQWEYACRAGGTGTFGKGSSVDDLAAIGWYDGNSGWKAHRVRQKPANPYGLYDTLGNVAEWCRDPYVAVLAEAASTRGGTGTMQKTYVVRGGAWDCRAQECRCAARQPRARVHRSPLVGFRLAHAF